MLRPTLIALALSLAGTGMSHAQDRDEAPLEMPPIEYSTEYPGEEAVDPHPRSNANAGAIPFEGSAMWEAFGGRDGVARIVETFVTTNVADPRISDIFAAHDPIRLRRTLNEQFCFILNGGCDYTGMDMKQAHKDLGIQSADMGALVENLQAAMRAEGVPFAAQNRFLAKLAPMRRDVVVR